MLIESRLLLQRAKALNIWPDNEAIKYLDSLRQQYQLPSMEALEEWIIREGIDREELMTNLRNQSVRNQVLRREVFWEVESSISDEEIQRYYASHKQNYGRKEGGFYTLEEVRNEIHDRIFDVKAQRAVQEYMVRLRKRSIIEVKPGYIDRGNSVDPSRNLSICLTRVQVQKPDRLNPDRQPFRVNFDVHAGSSRALGSIIF